MLWKETKNSLVSILDRLNDTFSTVQGDQEVFDPLLRTHPPSFRNTRREILEDQMEDVSAAWDQILLIEARVVQLKEEIKTRRVMRLAMTRSPVFALPDEILRRIFVHVCFNRDADDVEEYRSSIRLACRHWHAIASTRHVISLRAALPNARSICPIVSALSESRPHPVHLTVEPLITPEEFPTAATSDLGRRLRSLTWNTGEDLSGFLAQLSNGGGVSCLESLATVMVKGPNEDRTSLRPFGSWPVVYLEKLNSLSNLIYLCLEKSLTETFLTSGTLTYLVIDHCRIRAHEIVATLRNTPNLKYLRIAGLQGPFNPRGIFDAQYNVFEHSSLKTMMIADVSGTTAWALLYCGRYPNLQYLSISGVHHNVHADHLSREDLPPQLREGQPLEMSFYRTLLGSQKLEAVKLYLRPDLLQELCGSLRMRPTPHDSDFPRTFPAPGLTHLDILTSRATSPDAEEATRSAGVAILEILQLRQSCLRAFRGKRGGERFKGLAVSECLTVDWKEKDWKDLVDY